MLGLKIAGSKNFSDQIKNKMERMEKDGWFIYTDDVNEASIVISEEDACPYDTDIFVYIEVMKNVDGHLCALQYIMGEKVEMFFLKDLPSVLQGTIMMVSVLLKKENRIIELNKQLAIEEEKSSGVLNNLKNFKKVQKNVTFEVSNLSRFESELLFIPKEEVSGDFIVVKEMPSKTFVFIGDVTGHGLYAGTYAATLVALAKNYFDTSSLLNANLSNFMLYIANAAFYYHGGIEQSSCECVICEIDHKKNLASFCTFSGGNISPILIKQNGRVTTLFSEEEYDKIKPRLGDEFYENNIGFDTLPGIITKSFHVGDTILFYTDGFSELFSKTENGVEKDQSFIYGVENMERAVKDAVLTQGNNPETVVKAVVSDISSYGMKGLDESGKLEDLVYDDATMFCIRRKE